MENVRASDETRNGTKYSCEGGGRVDSKLFTKHFFTSNISPKAAIDSPLQTLNGCFGKNIKIPSRYFDEGF